jgi:hypothetical protein
MGLFNSRLIPAAPRTLKMPASVLSNPNFKVNPLARSRRFSAEALITNPNF